MTPAWRYGKAYQHLKAILDGVPADRLGPPDPEPPPWTVTASDRAHARRVVRSSALAARIAAGETLE